MVKNGFRGFSENVKSMSDKDLYKFERSVHKKMDISAAGLIGSTASGVFSVPLLGLGGVALTGGVTIPSAIAFKRFSKRWDVLHKEIDRRHKERKESRQRFMRELRLHGRRKMKKVM